MAMLIDIYIFLAGYTYCTLLDENHGQRGWRGWLVIVGSTALWPALWVRDWWRELRLPAE
jgi:hypothetical protein